MWLIKWRYILKPHYTVGKQLKSGHSVSVLAVSRVLMAAGKSTQGQSHLPYTTRKNRERVKQSPCLVKHRATSAYGAEVESQLYAFLPIQGTWTKWRWAFNYTPHALPPVSTQTRLGAPYSPSGRFPQKWNLTCRGILSPTPRLFGHLKGKVHPRTGQEDPEGE